MELVPEAKSVRSHSMTQSSVLLDIFASVGLTHDVNQFIPASMAGGFAPWILWNGLVRCLFCWEDDIACMSQSISLEEPSVVDICRSSTGLKIFNFHPVHVFLNTESLERYEQTRSLHQEPKELIRLRYRGYGTRSRLIELLQLCKQT